MAEVAVIDNGVDAKILGPDTRCLEVKDGLEIMDEKKKGPPRLNHGTVCAAIIRKFAREAKFTSLKITDDASGRSTVEQLLAALNWCSRHGIRLINLSMGTADYRDFKTVREYIDDFIINDTIIVAAYSNFNVATYPAAMPSVFGVKCDRGGLLREAQFAFEDPGNTDLVANSAFSFFENEHAVKTNHSNSFAAPVVTAAISVLLDRCPGLDFEGVKNILIEQSYKKSAFRRQLYMPGGNFEQTMPAIAIKNSGEDGLYLLAELSRLFEKDGYGVVVFSDSPVHLDKLSAVPIDTYLENGRLSASTLGIIQKIYNPGVALFYISEDHSLNKDLYDVFLICRSDCIVFEDKTERLDFKSADEAYAQILKMYS